MSSKSINVSMTELFIATLFSSLAALASGNLIGTNTSILTSLLYGGITSLVLALLLAGVLWLISDRVKGARTSVPGSYLFVYALVVSIFGVLIGAVVGQYESVSMSLLISVLVSLGMALVSVGFYRVAGKTKPASGASGSGTQYRRPLFSKDYGRD